MKFEVSLNDSERKVYVYENIGAEFVSVEQTTEDTLEDSNVTENSFVDFSVFDEFEDMQNELPL